MISFCNSASVIIDQHPTIAIRPDRADGSQILHNPADNNGVHTAFPLDVFTGSWQTLDNSSRLAQGKRFAWPSRLSYVQSYRTSTVHARA